MSGNPNQEYFSDGLTEQIINGLCKVSNLFVIARNSSFAYKGKSISVKQIAKELGVRYILEGSVQRAGDRVRITAQLIDATTDYHMWSENYDRDLEDIFALQDDITMKLISSMDVQLVHGEQAKLWDIYHNIQAYDMFMRGLEHLQHEKQQDNIHAISLLNESLRIEESATAYATLGYGHIIDIFRGWSDSILSSFEQAEKCAKKSLELDTSIDVSHRIMAVVHLYKREFDEAIREGELALKLSLNGAETHAWLAFMLCFMGEAEEAIDHLKRAIRLNPIPPYHYHMFLGFAYRLNGNYRKAIHASKKALSYNPDQIVPYLVMASSYAKMDELNAAKIAVNNLLRIDPTFSLEYYAMTRPYKNQSDLDDVLDSLRKAGLPD
jgi:adenylate cyclase